MKKALFILACFLFVGFDSSAQTYNTDSIINLLEGEWKLTGTFGGFCGCTTSVTPNDLNNINFEKHPTSADSVVYSYYINDGTQVTKTSKVGFTQVGWQYSGWYIENWDWPSNFFNDSIRYFVVNDTLLDIKPETGVADGQSSHYSRSTSEEFKVGNCTGNHIFQYATPEPSDSVLWEVKSGSAVFSQGNNFISVSEATDSTIMVMKVYNGNAVSTTSYLITLPDSCKSEVITHYTLSIDNCKLPYTHGKLITGGPHTVKYAIESGYADYKYSNGLVNINNATNGAVLTETIIYTNDTARTYINKYLLKVSGICANDSMPIDSCQFPYVYQYVTIQPAGYSQIWEVESGSADFTFVESQNLLTIKDASDGTLMLHITSYNGDTTITRYLLNVNGTCVPGKYKLSGLVMVNNQVWEHGMIYLYNMTAGMAVDSVNFSNGSYLFTNVDTGTYTLYAVPFVDSALLVVSSTYATTYYVNKKSIQEANTIVVSADTYGVDLSLMPTTTAASVDYFVEFETSVYPNPFNNQLHIKVDQDGVGVRVFNEQGSVVYSATLNQSLSLNTSNWKEGVYFVQVQTQNDQNTITVIK